MFVSSEGVERTEDGGREFLVPLLALVSSAGVDGAEERTRGVAIAGDCAPTMDILVSFLANVNRVPTRANVSRLRRPSAIMRPASALFACDGFALA